MIFSGFGTRCTVTVKRVASGSLGRYSRGTCDQLWKELPVLMVLLVTHARIFLFPSKQSTHAPHQPRKLAIAAPKTACGSTGDGAAGSLALNCWRQWAASCCRKRPSSAWRASTWPPTPGPAFSTTRWGWSGSHMCGLVTRQWVRWLYSRPGPCSHRRSSSSGMAWPARTHKLRQLALLISSMLWGGCVVVATVTLTAGSSLSSVLRSASNSEYRRQFVSAGGRLNARPPPPATVSK